MLMQIPTYASVKKGLPTMSVKTVVTRPVNGEHKSNDDEAHLLKEQNKSVSKHRERLLRQQAEADRIAGIKPGHARNDSADSIASSVEVDDDMTF